MTAADFNGDNKADLVISDAAFRMKGIMLFGNGKGGILQTLSLNSAIANAMGHGDFNGDGNQDLVIAQNGQGLGLLTGNGLGGFSQPTWFPLSGNVYNDMAVSDFNQDGKLDVVVLHGSNTGNVSILLGNGVGSFSAERLFTAGLNPVAIATGDLNGDTFMDLIIANADSQNVSILLGNGAGSFAPAVHYPLTYSPTSITAGDLNGDGFMDLAVAGSGGITTKGAFTILYGSGLGNIQSSQTYLSISWPDKVIITDFNRDGRNDLFVASSRAPFSAILLGQPGGTMSAPTQWSVGKPTKTLITDLNADGVPDIALAEQGRIFTGEATLRLILGDGQGGFRTAPFIPTTLPAPWSWLATGDLQGDGRPDIAGVDKQGRIHALLGDGAGGFVHQAGQVITPGASFMALSDLDNDRLLDAILIDKKHRRMAVAKMRPDGRFRAPRWYTTGKRINHLITLDLNHDHRTDIVTVSRRSPTVSILINQGQGTLVAGQSVRIPDVKIASYLTQIDFNRDGASDLAVASCIYKTTINPYHCLPTISLLTRLRHGQFLAYRNIRVHPYLEGHTMAMASGDFNEDGYTDLIVSVAVDGTTYAGPSTAVLLMLNNHHHGFSTGKYIFSGDAGMLIPIATDSNGDGHLDVIINLAGMTHILFGNGKGRFQHMRYNGTNGQLLVGDFNRDDRPDLIEAESGHLKIFLNQLPPRPPLKPGQGQITALNSSSIRLTWTDMSLKETGFLVYRKTFPGALKLLTRPPLPAGTERYLDRTAQPNRHYVYVIRAFDATGKSRRLRLHIRTLAKPTNFHATRRKTGVILSWRDKAVGESGYQLQRRTTQGWQTIVKLPPHAQLYVDASIKRFNHPMSYRIAAIRHHARSDWVTTIVR